MSEQPLLAVEGVSYVYPRRSGTLTAVDRVDMSVAKGEIVSIDGRFTTHGDRIYNVIFYTNPQIQVDGILHSEGKIKKVLGGGKYTRRNKCLS